MPLTKDSQQSRNLTFDMKLALICYNGFGNDFCSAILPGSHHDVYHDVFLDNYNDFAMLLTKDSQESRNLTFYMKFTMRFTMFWQ